MNMKLKWPCLKGVCVTGMNCCRCNPVPPLLRRLSAAVVAAGNRRSMGDQVKELYCLISKTQLLKSSYKSLQRVEWEASVLPAKLQAKTSVHGDGGFSRCDKMLMLTWCFMLFEADKHRRVEDRHVKLNQTFKIWQLNLYKFDICAWYTNPIWVNRRRKFIEDILKDRSSSVCCHRFCELERKGIK